MRADISPALPQMLGFFGAFVAYDLWHLDVSEADETSALYPVVLFVSDHPTVAAAAVMAAAAALAWRRVILLLHTPAQVAVGFVVGTTFGLVWAAWPPISANAVDEALMPHRTAKCVALSAAAVAALAIRWLPSYTPTPPLGRQEKYEK